MLYTALSKLGMIQDESLEQSVPPQHFHMLRSGLGSPLFLLFTHSCDSPLDCPLTALFEGQLSRASSTAAHYIQAP